MKKLNECIKNEYGSYILPFFWQHGDSQDVLLEEIEAIEKSGCREFCVESRIYEDFCGDGWWRDFGFILKEAKRRDMKVWLLDDKCFPTGFANGFVEKNPHLKKKHIRLVYMDVAGPKIDAAVIVPAINNDIEKLISVVAYKRGDDGEDLVGDGIDLIDNVSDGLVFLDIPKGVYRLYFVIETRNGKASRSHLIDMLNPDSCKLMIDAVYEPHYEHFKEYFGNTFAGFFSDEPCFGNVWGADACVLGDDMYLPVSDELIEMMSEKLCKSKKEILLLLPLLWQTHSDLMYNVRYCYMDAVSRLYERNFSIMLGDWCRLHGVKYIGHIIEDRNLHMRLGAGVGHYFRAMSGQDMAGCDIVLNQMISGFNDDIHAAPVSGKTADPEFYRYTLSKLASSNAHLDAKKEGRALCEIFGAFGWAEGVPMMKNLADNMLVGGINRFVPHAFSNRYPNPDCPPHFYCGGKNPQFDAFCDLIKYMQRMCHLFDGTKHISNVAVLYNCEADWCTAEHDLFQKCAKILLQNQIDFDFVPSDYFDRAKLGDGKFTINGESFKSIVVSYSSALPISLICNLKKLSNAGVDVIFCNEFPERYIDSNDKFDGSGFRVVQYENLPKELNSFRDIRLLNECKYLRYYHVQNEGKDVYMFYNEDIFNDYNIDVDLGYGGEYIRYDAWDNKIKFGKTSNNILKLSLKKSESCVIIFEEHRKNVNDFDCSLTKVEIRPTWNIYIEEDGTYKLFDTTDKLYNLAKKMPRYFGKIRYECVINLDMLPKRIGFSDVGEVAYLAVNDESLGCALFYPCSFDASDKFIIGDNKITVDVAVNLGYFHRDALSNYLTLPPMGMLGDIYLEY